MTMDAAALRAAFVEQREEPLDVDHDALADGCVEIDRGLIPVLDVHRECGETTAVSRRDRGRPGGSAHLVSLEKTPSLDPDPKLARPARKPLPYPTWIRIRATAMPGQSLSEVRIAAAAAATAIPAK